MIMTVGVGEIDMSLILPDNNNGQEQEGPTRLQAPLNPGASAEAFQWINTHWKKIKSMTSRNAKRIQSAPVDMRTALKMVIREKVASTSL
jgi:hypothetical protein